MAPPFPIGLNVNFFVQIPTCMSSREVPFWCELDEHFLLQVLTKPDFVFRASVCQKFNVSIEHENKYVHMLTTGGIMSIIYRQNC